MSDISLTLIDFLAPAATRISLPSPVAFIVGQNPGPER
jgi:hypothetical protein